MAGKAGTLAVLLDRTWLWCPCIQKNAVVGNVDVDDEIDA